MQDRIRQIMKSNLTNGKINYEAIAKEFMFYYINESIQFINQEEFYKQWDQARTDVLLEIEKYFNK